MRIKLHFEFDFDPEIHLRFPVWRSNQSPALLPSVRPERLAVDDFPANKIGVKCAKCSRPVPKFAGYKQYFGAGYFCEVCQYEADLPLRVITKSLPKGDTDI